MENNNLAIIIWILTIVYFNCKINNVNENFDNIPQYNADIESIRNLGSIAKALIGGNSYTFPGNLGVSGTLSANGNISSPTITSINTTATNNYNDLNSKINTANTNIGNVNSRVDGIFNNTNTFNGALILCNDINKRYGMSANERREHINDYLYADGGGTHSNVRSDWGPSAGLWIRNGDLCLTNGAICVASDKRIKNIISNNKNISDLELIDKLNIYRYKLKDNSNIKIGFIAQEVHEVLPEQVSFAKDFINNVMRFSESINNKIIKLSNHELNENDKIKIYNKNNEEFIRIITRVISENEFEINEDIDSLDDKVFISGSEVNDLHQIDYNSMFALSFSGVKELNDKLKIKDKQIKELNSKIENLIKRFENFESK